MNEVALSAIFGVTLGAVVLVIIGPRCDRWAKAYWRRTHPQWYL